jgi:hypothetical protein
MKKFRVIASYLTFCEIEIEAESEDQAWEIACDTDGGDFEPMGGRFAELSDWHINDVQEIKG